MASSLSRCVADNDDIMFLSFRSRLLSMQIIHGQLRIFGLEFRRREKHDRPLIIDQRHYTLYISFLNLRFDGLGSLQPCTHTIKHQ